MQLGVNKTDGEACTLCPRRCKADRRRRPDTSYCGAGDVIDVASVCVHRGEEPPLNPIVNVFFAHCNLHCVYCQNWQISGRGAVQGEWNVESVESLSERICRLLPETGGMMGLVTAAHYANHIPALVEAVRRKGFSPTVVYNSSGYENVQTLQSLEGVVDVYLPDFKYMDPVIASRYSHADDYPEVATAALQEMIRQVGSGLKTDADGRAYRGIIVRHLVLPGHVDNTIAVLDRLAEVAPPVTPFSPQPLHLSLMAQYYPPHEGMPSPIDRTLGAEEYLRATEHAADLGFSKGWIQELEAELSYRPDFTKKKPFEQ